ncbi:MAG: DNA polymerase III subunit delta [Oscillospiraceae bacterium]
MIEDEVFIKKIKENNIPPAMFLFGEEEYFLNMCITKIIKEKVPVENQEMQLKICENFKGGYDFLTTIGFFNVGTKILYVKGIDVEKLTEEDKKSIEEIIAVTNNESIFILTAKDVDLKKSAKTKKFIEKMEKQNVMVCNFALKDRPTIKRTLCAKAKKHNLVLEMDTADYLIEKKGMLLSELLNELDKLIDFAKGNGKEEITKKDIDLLVIPCLDSTAFDLSKSILANKYDRAIILLNELILQKIEPLAILGALNLSFIDIYRAKVALEKKKSMDNVISDFKYAKNRQFAVKNAFNQRSSLKSIRNCINALMDADIKLKSTKNNPNIVLEQMIYTMMLGK